MEEARVYKDYLVTNKLDTLGVQAMDLKLAVIAGELARNRCSLLHPKMFGGYSAFAERVKVLRERLIPRGWRSEIVNGLELVVNDKLKISVAVCTGSSTTGDKSESTQSKYSKGRATQKAVAHNQNQLSFDDAILNLSKAPTSSVEEFTTWYLMVNRYGDSATYELCLPVGLDDENRIAHFKERIFFEPVEVSNLTSKDLDQANEQAQESSDEIIVEVTRKN